MRNYIKNIISIMLALVIAFASCANVFAASNSERYIKDIILCSASSAEEAEKELKEQGYKLLSTSNLNESLADGMYVGYKATNDADEAITDISAMDMHGNYSYTDYNTLLKQMRENVSETIDGLIPMITSYRDNYKNKKTIAVEVYDILNKFYEDDSKMKMGDYLLSCDLKDTTDITKVFLQGYSPFIIDIQQLLYLAGESDSDKNWIEKMAASDTDALVDLYMDSYPTPNKAFSALAADYGNAAESIKLTWDALYENLNSVKEEYFVDDTSKIDEDHLNAQLDAAKEEKDIEIKEGSTTDDLIENLQETGETVEICNNVIDANLISYLDSLEYGDGTMLDFFMRSSEEVEDNELYTLAYFMGTKNTDQISNIGLTQTLSRLLVDSDNANETSFKQIDNMLSDVTKISIYDGVDRELFEEGVALSGPTIEKYASSGRNWSEGLFNRVFQPDNEFKWQDYFAFYILPTAASMIMYSALFVANRLINRVLLKSTTEIVKKVTNNVASAGVTRLIYNEAQFQKINTRLVGYFAYGIGTIGSGGSTLYRIVAGIRCAFLIFTAIMVVVSTVMLFITIFSDNEVKDKYTNIPNRIVDTISTENGDDYVAYKYVENTLGSAADLFNYEGTKGWLTLYYTKDKTVGNPITTNMKIVKGSSKAPLDYEGVSIFGKSEALNITSKTYSGKEDSANGTYLYFTRGSNTAAGSVFSNGNIAIAAGMGLVVGILIGTISAKPGKRRKKAEA